MKLYIQLSIVLICGIVMVTGCSSPEAGPAAQKPATPEELVRAWKELPKAGKDKMDVPTALLLSQKLAAFGNTALTPLVDVIAEDKGDPVAKVLAVMCLTPLIREEYIPQLLPLTGPEHETTTRVCAISLLGSFGRPETLARMKELTNDPERRVRIVANFALIQHGEPEGLARIHQIWADPETTAMEREQLSLIIPEPEATKYLDIWKEAASGPGFDVPARQRAITLLARTGDPSAVETLRACAGKEQDQETRALAQSALEALQARLAGPADAANAPAPAPEAPVSAP